MDWFYRRVLRPCLFSRDSEEIHDFTVRALGKAARRPVLCELLSSLYAAPSLPVDVFGLRFPNPVGLAAGMDKHAAAVPAWAALGFGFVELGGVTWHAQPGNPSPRMFRAVADDALINRMGFNNPGAEAVAETLRCWRSMGLWPKHPVGINLGKSKVTPLDCAAEDYANSFRALREWADFFVINVSSPNTPNLRQLQDKAALDEILGELQSANRSPVVTVAPDAEVARHRAERGPDGGATPVAGEAADPIHHRVDGGGGRPLLVKVAPDLSFQALDEILELIEPREIAGIVATNTTVARPDSTDEASRRVYAEAGGLSGRPLAARSTEVIRHIHDRTAGKLPIIGVGGIFTAEDAREKFEAGATLVQVYTGLVYEGPSIARNIVEGLIGGTAPVWRSAGAGSGVRGNA